jgi:hypothetical protein
MDVSTVSIFQDIQMDVGKALGVDLSSGENIVCRNLDSLKMSTKGIPDLRNDSELMLKIENHISRLLSIVNIKGYKSMQFPANIRILASKRESSNDLNVSEYRTTLLHCDSWSGAPQDTLNIFLGIFVIPGAPWLQMFHTFPEDHPAYSFVGPYSKAPYAESELVEVPLPVKAGTLVFWPTQTPHKTEQGLSVDGLWRISLDIRLRKANPYENMDELSDDNFSSTKMNSLGVYWSFPDQEFKSLPEKILQEREILSHLPSPASIARENYFKKYYG